MFFVFKVTVEHVVCYKFSLLFCHLDVSPVVLAELVLRISSSRLKLVMADAIFRNLCCRNGFTVGDDPLSLRKMVCVFLVFSHYVHTLNFIAFISVSFSYHYAIKRFII